MEWSLVFVALFLTTPLSLRACYLPQSVDFEDCLYPTAKAASSGFDWTTDNAAAPARWRRSQGNSLGLGVVDHTRQDSQGNCMSVMRVTEASQPTVVESNLVSPLYKPPDGSVCAVSFWVRTSATTSSDTITVLMKNVSNSQSLPIALGTYPVPTAPWRQITVPLTTSSNFQIIFRSRMQASTSGGAGSIAIDDVGFATSCCKNCHFAPRVDLECGMQGYNIQPTGVTLPWSLKSGGSGSSSTGPSNDHTFNSLRGHYLLVSARRNTNKHAVFQSPEYRQTGAQGTCTLSFAYHMKGAGIGSLTVFVQDMATGARQNVWTRSGQQGNDWLTSDVNYDSAGNYKLLFEATTTTDERGDIGLDDIVMTDGCCIGATISAGDPFGKCSSIGYDTRVDRPLTDRLNFTFIDESLKFNCNGTVISWRVRTNGACSYYMQVWRRAASTSSNFFRMHQEAISMPGAGEHTLSSTARFRAGDVVGWRHRSGVGQLQGSLSLRDTVFNGRTALLPSILIDNVQAWTFSTSRRVLARVFGVAVNMQADGGDTRVPVIRTLQPSHGVPTTTQGTLLQSVEQSGTLSPVTSQGSGATGGGDAQLTSEPFYPWVIMGLVLLAILVTMTIVLLYYVKTHWNVPQKKSQSPAHHYHTGKDAHSAGNRRLASNSSFQSAMKLPVINSSPLHMASSMDNFGKTYPPTPAMLDLSRPTLACEAALPSPGFITVPTPSVVKAFPGMSISQASPAFSAMPEYREPSPQLSNANEHDTTQDTSLAPSPCNLTLPGSHDSDEMDLASDGLAKDDGMNSDVLSGSLNETPSRKSEVTTYTNDSRPRSHSDVFMRSTSSRPHSRSELLARSIDSPFRGSFHRRTPYSDPVDMLSGKGSSMGRKAYPRYSSPYQEPAVTVPGIFAQLKSGAYKCLLRDKIDVQAMIAHGHYCAVYAGVWKKGSADVPVAVKTVYPKKEGDYIPFLREAAIMGQFSHRNIVQLFGVVMDNSGKAPQLILELMSDNLKIYLESLRPSGGHLPEVGTEHLGEHLLNMCHDVASGMAYLEAKGFIHRDLAARNIMIGSDRVCKIGDFSLCRDMTAPDSLASARGIKISKKWAAPEVLKHYKFSTFSDVWSYGILLYEIWSLGAEPFEDMDDEQVSEFLETGSRLPHPSKCPLAIYELMMDCWHPYSMERPAFTQLVQILEMTDRNILLGQITPQEPDIIYDEIEEKDLEDPALAKQTPHERLQKRYAHVNRGGEVMPKYIQPDDKRLTAHVRQTSSASKLTSLPRHMLAEQISIYSHGSVDTGSSSVTSV